MSGARVIAWMGLPGQGKTYSAVAFLVKERRRRPSARVYSNIPLKLPGARPTFPLDSVDAWVECHDAIVLLDEAHILFGSREWSQKDRARVSTKLGQLRKDGIQLLYTTHFAGKVDVRLRELTEEVRYMVAPLGSGGPFFYDTRGGFGPKERRVGMGLVWRRDYVDAAYSTDLLVGDSGYFSEGTPQVDVLALSGVIREEWRAGWRVVREGAGGQQEPSRTPLWLPAPRHDTPTPTPLNANDAPGYLFPSRARSLK